MIAAFPLALINATAASYEFRS